MNISLTRSINDLVMHLIHTHSLAPSVNHLLHLIVHTHSLNPPVNHLCHLIVHTHSLHPSVNHLRHIIVHSLSSLHPSTTPSHPISGKQATLLLLLSTTVFFLSLLSYLEALRQKRDWQMTCRKMSHARPFNRHTKEYTYIIHTAC